MGNQLKKDEHIISIKRLFELNLVIPSYQRPYMWSTKNMTELLTDIEHAIEESKKYNNFKYRIGTIILQKDDNKDHYNIVDGQQRIISMLLILHHINDNNNCKLLEKEYSDKTEMNNIHKNAMIVVDWFTGKNKEEYKKAFEKILEAVVICVKKESEAFQLFDSQNSRGKALDPHDLLKAYHLRAMKDYPYEMEHAVTKWEAHDVDRIKELFDCFLFRILKWANKEKTRTFTHKDIDVFKGVEDNSSYTFAQRVKKASPCFQIPEQFVEGSDFFEMVSHYLDLLDDVEKELKINENFEVIKIIKDSCDSTRIKYAYELFLCALLCYYDKFHNFESTAVNKLFIWAMMIRVDMQALGFSTINKYAIGENNSNYTNQIPMFSLIYHARKHTDITSIYIKVDEKQNVNDSWERLHKQLGILKKGGEKDEQLRCIRDL